VLFEQMWEESGVFGKQTNLFPNYPDHLGWKDELSNHRNSKLGISLFESFFASRGFPQGNSISTKKSL